MLNPVKQGPWVEIAPLSKNGTVGDESDRAGPPQGILRRVCADGGSIATGPASELDACGVKEIYSNKYAFAAVCANGRVRAWGGGTPPPACVTSEPFSTTMNHALWPCMLARMLAWTCTHV